MKRIRRLSKTKSGQIMREHRGPFLTECTVPERGIRHIVVKLFADRIEVKPMGFKKSYSIGYDALYWIALRKADAAAEAAKRLARKQAKGKTV